MTTKPIRKAELHSVRLDSDVWAAIKKLPVSLNQYLRKQLSGQGVFEPEPDEITKILTGPGNTITRTQKLIDRERKPLLKPKERK